MRDNNDFAQQILTALIDRAQQKQFTEFRLISSWHNFKLYYKAIKQTRFVLKLLRTSQKSLFKRYCKSVKNGAADFTAVLAYLQFFDIINFYEEELAIIKILVGEYYDYLMSGNILYALLGGVRDDL